MTTINIFNTHRWRQDDNEVETLREWLKKDQYYNFKFYDISKNEHAEGKGVDSNLKKSLRKRIDSSSIIIAFNNQSISYNDGSIHKYEVKYAMEKDKPILLIDKRGTSEVPEIYKKYSNLYTSKWNSSSIRETIKSIIK